MFFKRKEFYLITDAETNSVLCVCDIFAIASQLPDFLFDVQLKPYVCRNIFQYFFMKSLMKSTEVHMFKWIDAKKYIEKNNISNERIIQKSKFTQKFYEVFKEIYQVIENRRLTNTGKTTLAFQELIYLSKKVEALRFKDQGYKEEDILDYPYILQYAELANISYKQAADEIIFKSKLSDATLAKTEQMRLKHYRILKEAKTVEDLEEALKNFKIDLEYFN